MIDRDQFIGKAGEYISQNGGVLLEDVGVGVVTVNLNGISPEIRTELIETVADRLQQAEQKKLDKQRKKADELVGRLKRKNASSENLAPRPPVELTSLNGDIPGSPDRVALELRGIVFPKDPISSTLPEAINDIQVNLTQPRPSNIGSDIEPALRPSRALRSTPDTIA